MVASSTFLNLENYMNRYEFMASGYMLFGNNWKTDLAHALHFSEKSGSVAKMATGKRNVTNSVANDLISLLEVRAQNLTDAVKYLRESEKLAVKYSKFNIITLDEHGVRQWDAFQGYEVSDFTVILNDAALEKTERELEFISLVIAVVTHECLKAGNNAELIKIIPEYFDLQSINVNLNNFYIEYKKNEDEE